MNDGDEAPGDDGDVNAALDRQTATRLMDLARSVARAGENLLDELVAIYAKDATRYLAALDAALLRDDAENAARELHALKGASLSIGAREVASRVAAMEGVARAAGAASSGLLDGLEGDRAALDIELARALEALSALARRAATP